MIKLTEILNEYKVNKPVTYKYKIGETVREIAGDEEVGEILDRRPNWAAVKANPIEYNYIEAALYFDREYSEENEPWYLFKVLENDITLWYTESELQPYSLNENIITNTNNEKKTASVDGYDNVDYKVMPNTKFVELRIDKSPQYRLQHEDSLGYAPNNSLMSNTFRESILNRIVKHLRERNIRAIVVDDTIIMTKDNELKEYKVNTPDRGYKIADWVYKYFTEDPYDYDDEKAEVELGPDEAMAMGILWRNMNIFDKNTVSVGDIERWRNEPGSNLKDSTVDEIIHYLTSLVLIKKAQSLNEYKINKPAESLPSAFMDDVKDAINRHIVSLVKEYEGEPSVEFVKDEKYGTHDTIIDFIKEHMVVNHYEFEKDGKEIIASPLNASTISDEDVLDYLNDNIELKRYLNKVIWKAYFETIDINELRNKIFNYIKTKEHPDLPHQRNTKDYFDVYIPLLIDKVVDYYIEPSEIFDENDFVQQVNNTLLKSTFINEYKINSPRRNKYISIETDEDGNKYYVIDRGLIHSYLESVINPGYIDDVDTFMSDSEGWEESMLNGLSDFDIENSTGEEIEDFATSEMSFFLTSHPDEFPYKDGLNEYKINNPREQIIWNWDTSRSVSEDDYSEIYKVWGKSNLYNYFGYYELELDDNGENYDIEDKNIRENFGQFIEIQRWSKDGDKLIDDKALGNYVDFQGKIAINEYKINKPNSGKYRISWYDGPDQFAQEEIETTLSNAERIAIEKLKTQYQYRKAYEYWVIIDQNIGDDIITRWEDVERIVLDPEPDGLYVRIKVYDEDKREFVTTKTTKL